MGKLIIKPTECKYKEVERKLNEQFINGNIDQTITAEIIRGLTVLKHTSAVTSEQILAWAKGTEAQ